MERNISWLGIAPLVFACALLIVAAPVGAQSAVLDGKVFSVEAGDKGKPADNKDDIITFREGKFHSAACDRWGYGSGAYKVAVDGDATAFEAETMSETDGRLVWKGVTKGETVEGTFTHYRKPSFFRPNPQPIERWFKGKLKT